MSIVAGFRNSALALAGYGVEPVPLNVKLSIVPTLAITTISVISAVIKYPFRQRRTKRTLRQVAGYTFFRAILANLSPPAIPVIFANTDQAYADIIKQEKLTPQTFKLSNGTRGHWLGPKSAQKVILYFHGGGYQLPCTAGHMKWIYLTTQDLRKAGVNVATLVLSYKTSPQGVYPLQIEEASEMLRYLVEEEGRKPSDIIIVGDSAGGNLAMAVLSHMNHIHPSAKPLVLGSPLKAVVVISPWVDFANNSPSWDENEDNDIFDKETVWRAVGEYIAGGEHDNYNEPNIAPGEWWKGIEKLTQAVYVYTGEGELMRDGIREFAGTLKTAHPNVTFVEYDDAVHEAMIFDVDLGIPKQQYQKDLEQYITSAFA